MRPIVTDRVAWSVDLLACHTTSEPPLSPAETAEAIEMPFALRTRVGPRNDVLDWVQIPHGKGQLWGGKANHYMVRSLIDTITVAFLKEKSS